MIGLFVCNVVFLDTSIPYQACPRIFIMLICLKLLDELHMVQTLIRCHILQPLSESTLIALGYMLNSAEHEICPANES